MAGTKIMVVDDSATDRQYLHEHLSGLGFEVVLAASGEEAIVKARLEAPDLVLMDLVMPGVNGYQATREMSRNPATRDIPIIICSSKSQQSDRAWGLAQGARDYLTKPIDLQQLAAKIAALV